MTNKESKPETDLMSSPTPSSTHSESRTPCRKWDAKKWNRRLSPRDEFDSDIASQKFAVQDSQVRRHGLLHSFDYLGKKTCPRIPRHQPL